MTMIVTATTIVITTIGSDFDAGRRPRSSALRNAQVVVDCLNAEIEIAGDLRYGPSVTVQLLNLLRLGQLHEITAIVRWRLQG